MDKQDILSEVFSTLRLRGELYFRAELGPDVAVALPREQRRIRFHLVLNGHCRIRVSGDDAAAEPELLTEGDLAIVPDGAAQVLGDGPDAGAAALGDLLGAGCLADGLLRHGDGPPQARLLCGFCRFDEAVDHPALSGLPPLIVVRARDLGSEPWAAATLRLLTLEAGLDGQGTGGILARLLEIVFIQAVRRLAPAGDAPGAGFVAALRDARLARALSAIHRSPETAWTIQSLARVAGMSRARFAAHFTERVGLPPIGYLTGWRLARARALLATSALDMADIASSAGYASPAAFSRRFKVAFGVGPGTWRRAQRGGGAPG
ncbi:AraC family transcriptional regulator [Oceanibacterium hippocampi]|uniref:HTH-type transcriptional activator Btr n=1 Tax=Oceanibacterium hippocampi TaxID=745714 RepID=A0A1Y5SNA1_9PROT|nr:AraC family transcriptional regulator [Oceanibacterium hippocampi]SLN44657.1 HTH-type transcriptional activator Btr [Oceanibacterium hippocampi]